jgi:predicted small metal-binding protein
MITCECGYAAVGATEDERLEDARQHAGDVHGVEVTREQITAGGA